MENSPSSHQEMQQEMTIGRWLFNPFVRIAGARSLIIGLAGIVVAGLAAAGAGIHFDGLLDVHAGNEVALRGSGDRLSDQGVHRVDGIRGCDRGQHLPIQRPEAVLNSPI